MKNLKLYQEIEQFYNKISFPLIYTEKDLEYYRDKINNIYLKVIDEYLSYDGHTLDIGAGTGLITNLFASRYPSGKFTAIDISTNIYYGKKFSETQKILNTKWSKENFISYQTKEKFDTIICQGVLHHIPDWELAIEKIKALSKHQGFVLIAVYHPLGKFLQKFLNPKNMSETLRRDQFENPFEISFTKKEILKLMKPFELQTKVPDNLLNIKKSFIKSGGLILYVFKNI